MNHLSITYESPKVDSKKPPPNLPLKGRREGGRWHRPEMDEKDGKAVSKSDSDAMNKEKTHKDLHMSKKSCNFAADLEIIQKTYANHTEDITKIIRKT